MVHKVKGSILQNVNKLQIVKTVQKKIITRTKGMSLAEWNLLKEYLICRVYTVTHKAESMFGAFGLFIE